MEAQLSQQTVLEVRHGKYGPYVALGRIQEKSKRWVFLSARAWDVLTKNIDNVNNITKQDLDKEETIILTQRVKLTVSCYKDKYYIGVHSTDQSGERVQGRGMNLNMDEWEQMMQQKINIEESMNSRKRRAGEQEEIEAKKAKKEEQQTAKTIKQYQWRNVWPGNHNTIYAKDDCWAFTEEMCKKRLKAYNDEGYEVADTSTDIIVSRDIPEPKTSDIIKYIFMYYIRKEIIRLRDDMSKHAGRGFDEVDGCIWPYAVNKYFKKAKSKISDIQVMTALKKTMEVLKIDINMSDPDLLTLVLNVGMKEYELKQLINETQILINEKQDIRNDFYVLFSEICPNL